MQRSRIAAVVLLAFAACNVPPGNGLGGDPVKPVVEPPPLTQVAVEPQAPDRSEVVKVVLKEPQALPATQVDAYHQKPGVVDILWVIDNSGSMADERRQLQGNFQSFINTLNASQTDFHIGTIATDRDLGGQLHGSVKVIDRNTPNVSQAFLDQVTYPDSRVKWVQGLSMMKKFLSTPSLNQGFLRPGAALAVIALSDGDDESLGPVGYYARFLREVKGQGDESIVSFSTISGDVPAGCQSQRDAQFWGSRAEPSVRFTGMARSTGGVVGSICDLSFENTLIEIAEALNTLRKIFPLSLVPEPSTIRVTVNGAAVAQNANTGWTYVQDVNAIEFLGGYVPPPNAAINIQYAIASP